MPQTPQEQRGIALDIAGTYETRAVPRGDPEYDRRLIYLASLGADLQPEERAYLEELRLPSRPVGDDPRVPYASAAPMDRPPTPAAPPARVHPFDPTPETLSALLPTEPAQARTNAPRPPSAQDGYVAPLSQLWAQANTPAWTLPRVEVAPMDALGARAVRAPGVSTGLSLIGEGAKRAYNTAVAPFLESASSPLSLASLVASGGALTAGRYGLSGLGQAARALDVAANAPSIAHGAYTAATAETPGQAAWGAVEAGLGGLGMAGVTKKTAPLLDAPATLPAPFAHLREALPAKQWNLFAKALDQAPGARHALSQLEAVEVEPLTRSSGALETFQRTYDRLPSVAYLTTAIRRGAPKRFWYENSRGALKHLFGDEVDQFTGVLAAMSPQTSVESNLTNALNTFINWRAAGRPVDAATIRQIIGRSVQGGGEKSALDAWINNTVHVLQGGKTISGPKIDQFWLALRDRAMETKLGSLPPEDAMVLDAWMGNLFGAAQALWSGTGPSKKAEKLARLLAGDAGASPNYLAGVAKMREAARAAGVSPAEAQEMAWSTAMALYEKATTTGLSAREVLARGLLTDADVAGTPDFSRLLRDGVYGDIVKRDPALASRLDGLAQLPHREGGASRMTAADAAQMAQIADTLDTLRSMRVADTALDTSTRPAGTVSAVFPMEAATDIESSALLPYKATEDQRKAIAHLSPRIFGAGESLRKQNILLDLFTGTSSRAGGTGWWRDLRGRLQRNPMASYGRPVSVVGGRLDPAVEGPMTVAHQVGAMMTGQSVAAHLAIDTAAPRELHDALIAYAGEIIKGADAAKFGAALEKLSKEYAMVHSGRAVRVLRIDANGDAVRLSADQEARVRKLAARHLGTTNAKGKVLAPEIETGHNIATDGYLEVAQGAKPNSGDRVRRVVGPGSRWEALSAAEQDTLDARSRPLAARLMELYDMARVRKERPDEARMLEIIATSGLRGLVKAYGAGVVLPALAVLGLFPSEPES